MLELREMAAGLAALGAAYNREIAPQVAKVYHGVLGAKLTAEQWERAVRRALECESFFPPPAVLLRYGQAEGAPQARAVEVYEALLREYECGRHLGPRDVMERFGAAAMEGFLAAGGTRAFEWCEPDGQPFRRKAFVEGWLETTEQDPAKALPAGEFKALPPGNGGMAQPFVQISKAEAARVFAELAAKVSK